jgi:hypothetical protein
MKSKRLSVQMTGLWFGEKEEAIMIEMFSLREEDEVV